MKCLVVLIIALFAFVAADEEGGTLTHNLKESQIHDECVTQTGVTEEQLATFRKMERSDDSQVHEYLLCNLKKAGYFTEENGHNVDRLISELIASHLDEETARRIVAKCADNNEQKSSAAQWAYRCVECLWENKVDDLVRQAKEKARNKKEN